MGQTDDEERKGRWAKSLDEAGLLDEIDEGWVLPDDEPVSGSTIQVKGTESLPPSPADQEDVPFATPIPSIPPPRRNSDVDLPETPIELDDPSLLAQQKREVNKGGYLTQDIPDDVDTDATLPPTPVFVSSRPPKKPFSPDSSPIFNITEKDTPPSLDKAHPPARTTMRFSDENQPVSVVEVRGARISVAYGDNTEREGIQGDILDEPPIPRSSGSPMSLVEEMGVSSERRIQMQEHFDIGDYSGALEIAQEILEKDSENTEALKCRKDSRAVLIQMYESRIGSFDQIPVLAIAKEEIIWRNLDAATGFVLSQIDGMLAFEDIMDVSGLPQFETCQILCQLLQDGIIK